MPEILLFDYRNDWRSRMALLRLVDYAGRLPRAVRTACLRESLWTAGFLICAGLGLLYGSLVLVAGFLMLAGWHVLRLYRLRRAGRRALFHARRRARLDGTKIVRLTVGDSGFREDEAGKLAQAEWKDVRCFRKLRHHVAVEVGPGLWAIVPRAGDAAHRAQLERLVALLEERRVPRIPDGSRLQ